MYYKLYIIVGEIQGFWHFMGLYQPMGRDFVISIEYTSEILWKNSKEWEVLVRRNSSFPIALKIGLILLSHFLNFFSE